MAEPTRTTSMPSYHISTKCLVCADDIQKESSVLFLCDCIVPYCKSCAYRQVACQPSTYTKGLMCPICRQTSDNIKGTKECYEAETALCHRAMERYGFRIGRKESECLRKTLTAMYKHGVLGSLSHMDEKELETVEIPTLRLELARIQDQQEGGEASDFVMGPLVKLSFARNSLLEHIADCIRSEAMLVPQDGSPIQASALLTFGTSKKRPRSELRNNPATKNSASSLLEQPMEEMPPIDVGSFVQVIAGKQKGQIGRFVRAGSSRSEDILQVDFLQPTGAWITFEIPRKNVFQISDADAIGVGYPKNTISGDLKSKPCISSRLKKSIGLDDLAIIGDRRGEQQEQSSSRSSFATVMAPEKMGVAQQHSGTAAAAEAAAAAADDDDSEDDYDDDDDDDDTPEFSIPNSHKKFAKNDRVRVSSTSYEGEGTFVRYTDVSKAQVYVQNSSDTGEGSEGRLLTLHLKKLRKVHPGEDTSVSSKTSKKTRPRDAVETSPTCALLTELSDESLHPQDLKATPVAALKNKNISSKPNDDYDVKKWVRSVASQFPVLVGLSNSVQSQPQPIEVLDKIVESAKSIQIAPKGPVRELYDKLISFSQFCKGLVDTMKSIVLEATQFMLKQTFTSLAQEIDARKHMETTLKTSFTIFHDKFSEAGLFFGCLQHIRRVIEWCEVARDVYTLCVSRASYSESILFDLFNMADFFLTLTLNAGKGDDSCNFSQFTQFVFLLLNFWKVKLEPFKKNNANRLNIYPSDNMLHCSMSTLNRAMNLGITDPMFYATQLSGIYEAMPMLKDSYKDVNKDAYSESLIREQINLLTSMQAMSSMGSSFVPNVGASSESISLVGALTNATPFFIQDQQLSHMEWAPLHMHGPQQDVCIPHQKLTQPLAPSIQSTSIKYRKSSSLLADVANSANLAEPSTGIEGKDEDKKDIPETFKCYEDL